MSWLQKLIGAGLRPRVRARARGKSLEELADGLAASYARLGPLYERALDTPANRESFNHWLGIERWSQRRLRVARGEEFVRDRYHGYRLPDMATLDDLRAAFAATREESVALAREFAAAGVDADLTVPSNDLGDLSVAEWFAYIEDHASRERVRLKLGPKPPGA